MLERGFFALTLCIHLVYLEGIDSLDLTERLRIDRYLDQNGNVVFTEKFLVKRGICCGLGCTHCPYVPSHEAGNTELSDELKAYTESPK